MGLSFRQIANAINAIAKTSFSRNACIGRATRLHLPPRPSNPPPHPRKEPRPERRLPQRYRGAAGKSSALSEGFIGIGFEELTGETCHFPDDGSPALYCGQPCQDGSPYCPHCHARAYIKRG